MQGKNRSFFCNNDCLRISFYNKENRKHQKLRFDPTGAVFFTQRHIYIKNPVEKIVEFRNKDSLLDIVSMFLLFTINTTRDTEKIKWSFSNIKKIILGEWDQILWQFLLPRFTFSYFFVRFSPPSMGSTCGGDKNCMKTTKSGFLGQNSREAWEVKPIIWVVKGDRSSPPLGETLLFRVTYLLKGLCTNFIKD